jgi:L-iditol 2-dehydrogenase
MPIAVPVAAPALSRFEAHYDPKKVLAHPDFRILADESDPAWYDKHANLACAYNPNHEIHMIHKPMPRPGKGEAVVHIKATGICG